MISVRDLRLLHIYVCMYIICLACLIPVSNLGKVYVDTMDWNVYNWFISSMFA